MVAGLLWEQDVAGSNPVIPTLFFGGVVLTVAQRTLNPSGEGSNPFAPTDQCDRGLIGKKTQESL